MVFRQCGGNVRLQRSGQIETRPRDRRTRDIGQRRFECAHRLVVLRHAADAMQAERNHTGKSTLLE